jgi:hypothetical protein
MTMTIGLDALGQRGFPVPALDTPDATAGWPTKGPHEAPSHKALAFVALTVASTGDSIGVASERCEGNRSFNGCAVFSARKLQTF